ncbi:putative GTP diphosphokinase CRSH1 [Chlorella vulgaris]
MTAQVQLSLACGPAQGVQRAAAGRLQLQPSGLALKPIGAVREEGPSSSGRGCSELLRPPKRGSPRPLAYSQSPDHLGPLDPQQSSSNALLAQHAGRIAAGAAGAPSAAPAQLLPVQQGPGGASLLQLVAAWDRLAARLPPQASCSRAADVILSALKLVFAYSPPPLSNGPSQQPGEQQPALSRPVARALSLSSRLADLAAAGLPIDAESIAAGILAELVVGPAHQHPGWTRHGQLSSLGGAASGALTLQVVEERVGPIVAQLVHDIQRARQLPARVELLDDTAASALRELCLSFYDVRATTVEVVSRLDVLTSPDSLPSYEQQVCALEALQMYAPMGHALGLSAVAAQLEDRCFQILFPESYLRTAAWLCEQAAANAVTLQRCQQELSGAVLGQQRFAQLAAGVSVKGRTKTLFSTLKKLLRLGNTAAGGRARAQLYDLIGLRAVVQPRTDLPADEAEELAAQACYLVQEAACALWQPVPGRCKDYVSSPKSNGYQSLHSTVRVPSEAVGLDGASSGYTTLELQIRTQVMDDRAERGEAAHGAYKGGLDAAQALQLKSVTEAVLQRTAAAAAATPRATSSAAGLPSSSDAAAEGLFRHLDQNGDGRISLEELQFALQELGVREVRVQSAAAAELLQLAAADDASGGDGEAEGTIGFEAFMAFQRRVGLLQALSAVDHLQAEELEGQQQYLGAGTAPGDSLGSLVSSLSSFDLGSSPETADSPRASRQGGSSGSSRQAAGACRAQGRSSTLCWQPQGTGQQQLAGGRLAGRRRGAALAARAFTETSSASLSSSSGSMDDESLTSSGNGSNGKGGRALAGSASRIGSGSVNSVVALNDRRAAAGGSFPHRAHPAAPANGVPASAPEAAQSSAETPAAEVPSGHLLSKPARVAPPPAPSSTGREHAVASHGEARDSLESWLGVTAPAGSPPANAIWQLVALPSNPHRVQDATGSVVPIAAGVFSSLDGEEHVAQALRLPDLGPCVIGAVYDKDCDFVLDVPTVSGRHALLEVVRRPDARGGYSKLVITDLASTNGTRINGVRVKRRKEVALYPGDVVTLAEAAIAFEVQALPGDPHEQAHAASSHGLTAGPGPAHSHAGFSSSGFSGNVPSSSSSSSDGAGHMPSSSSSSSASPPAAPQEGVMLPPVAVALRLATALEAVAAAQGHFPPGGAVYADLPDRARGLMTAGSFEEAHALLLAGAMQQPWEGGLWAQLGNLERQRAKRGQRGSSYAVARAFFAAAAACFGALTAAAAGGAVPAASERSEGLCRVLGSWAQLELSLDNLGPGRTLYRKAVAAARQHPVPATATAAVSRTLFTWAHREWKAGDGAEAYRLCGEALESDPTNVYVLSLLGNMEFQAGQARLARRFFERALKADPCFVTALQSLARLEASRGFMDRARPLFKRALHEEPGNTYVLQAWAVAEARQGNTDQARSLFKQCTVADPACIPAWHAWAKLEEEAWHVDEARRLYKVALALQPDSVKVLSALGRLERRVGDLRDAAALLEAAQQADPLHAPSAQELALVRKEQGRTKEAKRLLGTVRHVNRQRSKALHKVAVAKLPSSVRDAQLPPGSQPQAS